MLTQVALLSIIRTELINRYDNVASFALRTL